MKIESLEQLTSLYPPPKERTLLKQLDRVDAHTERYIALSPFLVLSTISTEGKLDASPRGGVPGFVKLLNEKTLLIPDSKGNNRLDSLHNIVETGRVGLLFFLPGMDESLRVNGSGHISTDADLTSRFDPEKQPIATCIVLEVEELYLHCAKAFMRSKLWDESSKIDRSSLPSMGQMLKDQIGHAEHAETRPEMLKRYEADV